jgi:hypothetical protein
MPFEFLGTAHIAALCFLVLLNLFLLRDRKKNEQARKKNPLGDRYPIIG